MVSDCDYNRVMLYIDGGARSSRWIVINIRGISYVVRKIYKRAAMVRCKMLFLHRCLLHVLPGERGAR